MLQQLNLFIPCGNLPMGDTQNMQFGKTSQERSQAIKGWTLNPCLKRSQKPVFQFLDTENGQNQEWLEAESVQSSGEHWTPSIGEYPSVDVESSLLQILQTGGGTEEILFKPESLSRDFTTGEEKRRQTKQYPCGCIEKTGEFVLNDQGGGRMDETIGHTNVLRSSANHPPIVFDATHHCDAIRINEGITPTLTHHMGTGGNNVPLVYSKVTHSDIKEDKTAACLCASGGDCGGGSENYFLCDPEDCPTDSQLRLRRLTPLECERLQGLPDNWTLIDDKTCSDSARYKAIGNGMAQPCADFVMSRIAEHEESKV